MGEQAKRVLLIGYAFPPLNEAHTQRLVHFANALSNEFHVAVLTVGPSESHPNYDAVSSNRLAPSISVLRAREGVLHKYWYSKKRPASPNKNRANAWHAVLNKVKETFLVPDPLIDWVHPAYVASTNHFKNHCLPDVIVTSSAPYSAHILGHLLSKKFGVPHIMDYGDPWVFEHSRTRGFFRFRVESMLERHLITHASAIIMATDAALDLYRMHYDPKRCCVATMGFHPSDFPPIAARPRGGKIRFIYGGSLDRAHRDPQPFFAAIGSLSFADRRNISVELYTNDTYVSTLLNTIGLEEEVRIKRIIPFESFVKELLLCDVAVLFGNSSQLQIPGKLYQYLGAGLPILYIANQEPMLDPAIKVIAGLGGVHIATNEQTSIRSAVLELLALWEDSRLHCDSYPCRQRFQWTRVLSSAIELVKSVASRREG